MYIRRRGNEKKFATKEEMKASPFLFLLKKYYYRRVERRGRKERKRGNKNLPRTREKVD